MTKLVSRNPVQRFKEGRKIIKADEGTRFERAAKAFGSEIQTNKNGNRYYTLKNRNYFENGEIWDINTNKKIGTVNDYAKEYSPTQSKNQSNVNKVGINTARRHDYGRNDVTYEFDKQAKKWKARYNQGKDTNWYYVAEGSTGYDRFGNHNVYKNGQWVSINSQPEDKRNVGVASGTTGDNKTNNVWLNGYNRSNDIKDVRAMQQQLINEGYDIGKWGVDGKWGEDTEKAYRAKLLHDGLREDTISNIPERTSLTNSLSDFWKKPVTQSQEIAVETPYYTTFNYTGSNSNIRNLGFNNYAGLQNFVRGNANNQFAKDLVQRFGNVDTWNQSKVEGDLGISGTYRRGAGGDYSDIMRNMAGWAGDINGKYNNWKKQNALRFKPVTSPEATQMKPITNNSNNSYWENVLNNLKLNWNDLYSQYIPSQKKGGLISRNPVKQFKVNFRKEAL